MKDHRQHIERVLVSALCVIALFIIAASFVQPQEELSVLPRQSVLFRLFANKNLSLTSTIAGDSEPRLIEKIVEVPVTKVVVKEVEKIVEREVVKSVDRVVYSLPPVRVFVYDLPDKFHQDFYSHPDSTKTPYAAEWWIYQDIIRDPSERNNSASVCVTDPQDADVFLVPYMASQAFNCDDEAHFLRHNFRDICGSAFHREKELQEELKTWLEQQEPWQRSGGIDHVCLSIHPIAYTRELGAFTQECTHLLVDFAFRFSWESSLEKDVVVPHSHLPERLPDDLVKHATSEEVLDEVDTLLFFAGSLVRRGMGRIRNALQEILQDEPDVVLRPANAQGSLDSAAVDSTAQAMRRSRFCLSPAGDTPSSSRLADAIVNLCVPVIVSDDIEIPFEGQFDFSKAVIFVREADAVQPGFLMARLRSVTDDQWLSLKRELAKVRGMFEYNGPGQQQDSASAATWREVAARLPSMRTRLARRTRGMARRAAATHDRLEEGRRFEDGR